MSSPTFIIDGASEHRSCHFPLLARRVRRVAPVKYVLIAEDDPDIAAILSQEIGDRLYLATHIVANGALVPEALVARRPDLLILDIALPGLSGLDVFDVMRGDPQWQGVPVLFLTGTPDNAEILSAVDATGLHHVLGKPFDTDELVRVVDGMIDGRPSEARARLVNAA